MAKLHPVRGWTFLTIFLVFLAMVLHQLWEPWKFYVVVSIFVGASGIALYFAFRRWGVESLRAVGQTVDQIFVSLADYFAYAEEDEAEPSSRPKQRVPRPSGYWKAQLIEVVGGQCELQHCGSHRNLEVHHIKEHSQGGTNDLKNLLVLCTEHHKDCQTGGGVPKTRQRYIAQKTGRFKNEEFPLKWKEAGNGTGRRKAHQQKNHPESLWD